jgi:excisionase family DNA binding protein
VTGRLVTARELAEHLGFSAGTIVDWYEAGEIPGFKIGGRLRFRISEVEAWLERHRGRARLDSDERPDDAAAGSAARTRPDLQGGLIVTTNLPRRDDA